MSIIYILFCIIGSSSVFSISSYEKYCVNCKYFVKHPLSKNTFGKCSAFRKKIENHQLMDYLVSGKQKIEYKFCSSARENEDLCGKEGKMYMERSNFFKDYIQPCIQSLKKDKEKENNINIL